MRTLSPAILLVWLSTAPAFSATYKVEPDGSGDFPTIQKAIDYAANSDIILLGNGTFKGTGNRDVDYCGKAIMIRSSSGHAADCIIDCEGSTTEPHRGFLFISDETAGAVLSGVTITNGHVSGDDSLGGAVKCSGHVFPIIQNCIIRSNRAHLGGGLMGEGSCAPSIHNCLLERNTAVAGAALAFCSTCSPLLAGCTIQDNVAEWGGALVYGGLSKRADSGGCATDGLGTLAENESGAAPRHSAPSSTSMLQIKNTDFCNNLVNSLDTGGGIYFAGHAKSWMNICASTFFGNGGPQASSSGAISFSGSQDYLSRISFCSFARNGPEGGGPAGCCVHHYGGALLIESSVMAMNRTSPVECGPSGTVELTDCCNLFGNQGGDWVGCIAGQYGVAGNFSQDPLFCNVNTGNLWLAEKSPCLPENNECGYLIGARTWGCTVSQDVLPAVAASGRVHLDGNRPNPFGPRTTIRYTLPTAGAVRLSIHDLTGRRVRLLIADPLPAGEHHAQWDGRDDQGVHVASGAYFYRLDAGRGVEQKALVLVR